MTKKFFAINDQAIEQGNRALSVLTASAQWMHKKNYMKFVQLCLEVDNRKITRVLQNIKNGYELSFMRRNNVNNI